jgi:hypothetical protein
MELKNAVAVCLIALFSATLVVLIARSLDNQAASRIEPQLAQIAEELRALRAQGGIAASADPANAETISDGLVVYYFHSNVRCPTCQSIESQAKETVQTHFATQLKDGELAWKIVNYEKPSAKTMAAKYEIQSPVVVLVKMQDGKPGDWKRLDKVWALVGDKPAFIEYVRGEIDKMLAQDKKSKDRTPPAIPVP